MNNGTTGRAHWSFRVIVIVALIWNLLGVMNFVIQMIPRTLAMVSEPQQTIVASRPAWATAAFAIAVVTASVGCVLLLLRKSAATSWFVASLIAMIVQVVPYFGLSDSPVRLGAVEIASFILMPLAVAVFLIWYANWTKRQGWIA
jgi:hypothetical protein